MRIPAHVDSVTDSHRLNSAPLKFIVGKDEQAQTFYLHEDQAVKFSDVIAAAVKGGFKEAEERAVKMPEDDPELFKIFAAFTYSGAIHCSKPGDAMIDHIAQHGRLAKLWILAEKMRACEFKDAIVDAMVDRVKCTGKCSAALHKTIYANSFGPSGMRRLVVDVVVWGWPQGSLNDAVYSEALGQFFFDVASRLHGMFGRQPGEAPFNSSPDCYYHDHGSERTCYKTLFA